MAVSRLRASRYRPASRGVMIENPFERGDATVVHIGSGDRYVAERGGFECSGVRFMQFRTAEVKASVAAEAGVGLAEEEHLAALCRR